MNKQEFLNELESKLYGLPDSDIQSSLDFYSEMIDDSIDDGLSQEEAIFKIGTPQEIAKQILINTPMIKLVKKNIKPKRRMCTWEIVLLCVGSPIWLSLFIALLAVVFSVYVSLWAAVVSLWSSWVAVDGSVLGLIISAANLFINGQNTVEGIALIGAALFLVGFSIFFFFVCKTSTKGMIWLTKRITFFIKSCLLRKEELK